jgi:hypothetical protein
VCVPALAGWVESVVVFRDLLVEAEKTLTELVYDHSPAGVEVELRGNIKETGLDACQACHGA